ncbi:RusA family crossover junction endodeoxyribonuclease [Deinococcus wulumuqiensis]|uniref:RusA family crossover junction endodeoxyribonuclease n=1 Tax=Deinococcus wulumuqiensis TaxID=980427 RepID=UPI00242C9C92|nr:RusA family crossover junction endodeoxyribonuclease [Deinococcus wulumuqiensis]
MNPFPTRQAAEQYLARIPDPAQREATRARLGLVTSPPAQNVPAQEKQASGLNTLPPPRKLVHSETAPRREEISAPCTLQSKGALSFSLPYPPSMNAIWRAVVIVLKGKPQARVLLSQQGRAYRKAVQNVIRSLDNPTCPPGARLHLHLTAHSPDRRARDLSNIPKALEDALTHAQVWADDSLIDRLTVDRGEVTPGGRVDVVITPLTNTLFGGQP